MKKVLGVLVVFCCIGYGIIIELRGRYRVPYNILQIDMISEAEELRMPFLFRAFNPGVVEVEERYLVVARCDRYGWQSVWKKWTGEERRPKLFALMLNRDLQTVEKPSEVVIDSSGVIDPNDPRMLKVGEKIYLVYNDMVIVDGIRIGDRFMHLGEIIRRDGSWHLGSVKRLQFAGAYEFYKSGINKPRCEKNWTPVAIDGELHFVFMIDPLIIIKPDLETGICEEIQRGDLLGFSSYGVPRGGTPLIPVDNHFLGFYHIRAEGDGLRIMGQSILREGGYYFGAYSLFENNGLLGIGEVTEAVLTGKGLYQGRKKIVYPTGVVSRENDLLLFWGEDDRRICMGKIAKEKLKDVCGASI